MKTSTIDTEQGTAVDVVEIHTEDVEDSAYVVADIALEDDDQLVVTCQVNDKETSLWIPLERIRLLLNGNDPRYTPEANAKRSEAMKKSWAKRKKTKQTKK